MKALFTALIATVMALLVTSCSLNDLANLEPSPRQQHEFERQVTRSVRRAVNSAGIDNGSTIVVTAEGDTLIAPVDSLRHAATHTVYIDIQPPAYPRGISTHSLEILSVITVVSVVAGAILLILIGVFVIVVRRQHGRNKAINHAIDQSYPLPEAFYTGVPSPAPVTINRIERITDERSNGSNSHHHNHQHNPEQQPATDPACPPPPPAADEAAAASAAAHNSFMNTIDRICAPGGNRPRDLRNSFILIGLGLIVFFAFMSERAGMMAFLCGGSLFVLGAAKLLSLYFANRN